MQSKKNPVKLGTLSQPLPLSWDAYEKNHKNYNALLHFISWDTYEKNHKICNALLHDLEFSEYIIF